MNPAEAVGPPSLAAARPAGAWTGRLLREVAPARWDGLLRACGIVGLVALLLTAFVPDPRVSDLATLFSLSLFINGPYSPLTPIGFEPMLMAYGKLYPPFGVAMIGLTAQLMVEYVNYHLYDAALHTELMRSTRESRVLQRVLGWYRAAPFLTTVVVAFTPIPYWTLRITAPLARYPMSRHLTATAVGRIPRLWFYAAIGTLLPFSSGAILGTGLGIAVLFVVIALLRRRGRGAEPA
jgi:hypothetical protein